MSEYRIDISVTDQCARVHRGSQLIHEYPVSTAKNGLGEREGSEQTPRGQHIIRAKIGSNQPMGAVFVERRPTGEIYSPELAQAHPDRDWILTRILWLSGTDVGKNRLGEVDTMRRFIYCHGTPDELNIGHPVSHGCIRFKNRDILELFDLIPVRSQVTIQP